MTDSREEARLERAAAALRAASPRDDEALAELLARLRAVAGAPIAASTALPRHRRRKPMSSGTVKYVAGLAAGVAFAAGLGIGLISGWNMRDAAYAGRLERTAGSPRIEPVAELPRPVEFLLVAPRATRVALVGEFNDWDPAATPMELVAGGTWRTAVPLGTGRHLYAFVVDGSHWVPDPQAPLAPEQWFGSRNSVLLVGAARP